MSTYLYENFVETLSQRFDANLSTIEAEHNFEYGPEFEVLLAKTLRKALPDKFGITLGYVVDANSRKAGNDIIIFEQSRFPTLKLREKDDYSRKEYVPVEAVYCYIEAKHTLNIEGNDPQSLLHACKQVSHVKELCAERPAILPDQIGPYTTAKRGISVSPPPDYPEIKNPVYGAVFARQVRRKAGDPTILVDPQEIDKTLGSVNVSTPEAPDIFVLGQGNVVVPGIPGNQPGSSTLRSPFFIPNRSQYYTRVVEKTAFGIGLTSIMAALDWIQLGVMPWRRIIANGLGIPFE